MEPQNHKPQCPPDGTYIAFSIDLEASLKFYDCPPMDPDDPSFKTIVSKTYIGLVTYRSVRRPTRLCGYLLMNQCPTVHLQGPQSRQEQTSEPSHHHALAARYRLQPSRQPSEARDVPASRTRDVPSRWSLSTQAQQTTALDQLLPPDSLYHRCRSSQASRELFYGLPGFER